MKRPADPNALRRYDITRPTMTRLCLILIGMILGSGGSLWVLWRQLDAIQETTHQLAAACLNPRPQDHVTSEGAARVIIQKKDDVRNKARGK